MDRMKARYSNPLRRWIAKRLRRSVPKSDIALVTANFGGIDPVMPLPPRSGIDALYYTDAEVAVAADRAAINTWTAVIVPDQEAHLSSRLRSRYFKHQIHRLPEVKSFRWLVWADSACMFKELDFINESAEKLERLPPHERLMLVPHPQRQTVQQEFDYVIGEMKHGNEYFRVRYDQDKMKEGIEHLKNRGFNLQGQLWCGGFWIVENNSIINQAWDAWWAYTLKFGTQDQYYLPAAVAEFNLRPQPLNINIFSNRYFDFAKHSKNT